MPTIPSPTPAAATTMRAVVQTRYGSADTLLLSEIARPQGRANEVVLRVSAAGVDRGAWHIMTGRPFLGRLVFGLLKPRNPVLGMDVAGTVVSFGSEATRFAVGDEVYGFGRGTFAEYAVAKAGKLSRKPSNLSFEQAAVVPVSGATALQGLKDIGRLRAGQSVLVIGASGGVGSFAVQLAKAFGTEVTGVCSTGKLDFVTSLGADHVIDYTREDFADGSQRYDLILDLAGNPSLSRLRQALSPKGRAVIAGGEEGGAFSGGMNRQLRALAVSPFVGQTFSTFIAKQRSSDLEQLTELIDSGRVSPALDRTYPLEDAADAIRQLASGTVRGKVAIAVR